MSLIKARLVYAGAVGLMVVAGLGTRAWSTYLPDFIANHFGDALWAAMVYFGFRVIGIHKRKEWSLFGGALFCAVIELSQLYQADWINAVRGTALGGLVLGHGFLFVDLIRYGIGLVSAYVLDKLLRKPIIQEEEGSMQHV
ncbi:DUF2809 domain-containing protein [Paenibacillus sp. J5C_2022]|uniref:ribosomal maturation YjgA family protein n=1 Tax=Paenibacillus sp. J5C2022 TaxID=2977129 RepID=UPI0021D00C57|nr:DUF2809 domain-containing protein [Paenibacillus sp. J5C2022]MCU6712110.1 DUF2809 domain-containing protein [Paenibacillus sp. J5C2022]